MSFIRVAVADDSAFIRQAVARMLQGESGIVLAGLAGSGEELLDHLDTWRPDVIILDLSMPGLGGLATLDAVMVRRPTPVLILSTHSRQDAPQTIEALHRGALDFIDKQQYSLVDFEHLRAVLLEKILHLTRRGPGGGAGPVPGGAGAGSTAEGEAGAQLRARALAASPPMPSPAPVPSAPPETAAMTQPELLLIGASTGGPPAIEAILGQLGDSLPLPLVVVQHMPAGFTRSFADRLNAGLPLPVREVTHEEPLLPGTVYVAPGGIHLRLARARDGLRAVLSTAPEGSAHRPSLDQLFASAAAVTGGRVLAVVLTGMGHDGAAGVAALAHAGAYVIAQDEATSAVHGMPRAAIATGGVREILPLSQIGPRLRGLLVGG